MTNADLTCDKFLGGRLNIWQPKQGFRSGTDAILLASAVPVKPHESVLELGCGVGVVSLSLGCHAEGLRLCGVELQEHYAALAERNAQENSTDFEVVRGDVLQPDADLKERNFDHVVSNPPYFVTQKLTDPARQDKAIAHVSRPGTTHDWVVQGLKRLKPKGYITVIQCVERMPELVGAIASGCGDMVVIPISSRAGEPASRVIIRGRKGAKGGAILRAPLIMHKDVHASDAASKYSELATSILRDGHRIQ